MNKKLVVLLLTVSIGVVFLLGCSNHSIDQTILAEKRFGEEHELEKMKDLDGQDKEEVKNEEPAEEPAKEDEKIKIPKLEIDTYEIPDNEAMRLVTDMRVGWNLGNTLDAAFDNPNFSDELMYESSWCGVKTTKEMIKEIKESGFHSIRIPVSWHNHITDDNFTISEPWMDRVQEVVDYAVEQDLYIILNIHHDITKDYYYPSKEFEENSSKYMASIWKQIGNRFGEYNEKLIFEAVNEPRLVGTNNEWWLEMNKEDCRESVEIINGLNQVFVNTVRSTGKNNTSRYLMVPGYSASPENVLIDEFTIPTDLKENDNKIILSVHAYTPYNFALQAPNESGSITNFDATSLNSKKDINFFMDRLYEKYISKGIPVIIGEFGARDKQNNLQDRVDFAAYYTAYARARGMTCFWWDNNAFVGNGENFGLLDRRTVTWKYPEILEALIKYSM
ncbi:MAG: glycoside hydrolase family 5 protein [Epulopiscium sp.]|nr:glycoside hydrolase family 5 protein [Candidatus Epulonipiscium sp.]